MLTNEMESAPKKSAAAAAAQKKKTTLLIGGGVAAVVVAVIITVVVVMLKKKKPGKALPVQRIKIMGTGRKSQGFVQLRFVQVFDENGNDITSLGTASQSGTASGTDAEREAKTCCLAEYALTDDNRHSRTFMNASDAAFDRWWQLTFAKTVKVSKVVVNAYLDPTNEGASLDRIEAHTLQVFPQDSTTPSFTAEFPRQISTTFKLV